MIVKLPRIVVEDNKEYRLYLEYKWSKLDSNWEWTATYVGESGILYISKPDSKLGYVEQETLEFLKNRGICTY